MHVNKFEWQHLDENIYCQQKDVACKFTLQVLSYLFKAKKFWRKLFHGHS